MKNKKTGNVLAFDFGASSGRAMIGFCEEEKDQNGSLTGKKRIRMQEIYRFQNDPVLLNGTLYWDFLRLMHEIKQGIIRAKEIGFDSIGIDTWGVDFGLLDAQGRLLENPVHYRDSRTEGMLETAFRCIDKSELYRITGNQFMEINTVFQLLSVVLKRPELMERTQTMLMIPDLMNYYLTGVKKTEYSIATTSQMLDAITGDWSETILDRLQIPKHILTPILATGSIVGELSEEICEELGVEAVPVIAVAEHDTQSAMAAVPDQSTDFIFLSCGTWSLFGTELPKPIMNEKSIRYDITNEGGYGGRISFLKNIIGLWLIQESRRQWIREGKEYSFAQLEQLALPEEPLRSLIDPDAPEFVAPGNIPERIRAYCRRTHQPVPETVGQVVRCIDESLAMKYRIVLDQIKECTGLSYDVLHIIGGGAQSALLCQLTADACHMTVAAGPVEATVLGNVAIQMIANGTIRDLEEARQLIADSGDVIYYEAHSDAPWEKVNGFS